ncbi:hypothetical protein CANTEDRAFT_123505 [Yamadazyma tenuis ATCC 10573]|uniref:Magnesium transporter n=1 Tax=Candida tenuis (strain ATCC 10573 / BCRC 21748 / CBS 615 / JCM 9827 / NBRC 10315 / NRRL Y-1498 / VKM Y-70) TaxID=590646 RepID=G3B607_CANTC|nr:uncharacterized protein CANTEDRAFT_123505 [Yamadazyma tenuis ATCC 10573]EGV63349.1 hypothetical protein CANTEDRAFT_123505 [Yamadazyma tenuis ATCC 10573]
MFHPIESVTDPENQIPTFKGFTSNANTKIDISKMGKLKPVLPNDAYVSCTVFDQSGNNIAISKRYPKMQFLKDHNLHPRDLRKIDTSLVDVAPQIMIRPPNTILVNLSHIKALIKEEQVMIFDTSSPEIATKLGLFIYDLESKLKAPNNMPFEFKVLETILINVMGYLEAELKVHIQNCGAILSELESQVDRKKLQDLLIRSKGVQSYYQKVLLIKQALETLLDNDEDLAAMYLLKPRTAELKGHTEEIENILESYYSHCDEFVQHSGSLVHDIKATEEIVNIILDANRNSLMLFELKVTIYTLGITFATLVPAFYGMNLKNFIEESQYGFGAVVAFSILQGLFLTMLNLKALNKVQRLTRMGGSSRSKKMGETLNMSRRDVKQEWLYVWMKYMKMKRTHYHYPTMKERFAIWRMMNDNRRK